MAENGLWNECICCDHVCHSSWVSDWVCACTSIRSASSGQGRCSPWDRPAPGRWMPLLSWTCQTEAHTLDHKGAFPSWHLSATILKSLFPPCPGHLKTSTFCNHFHKNRPPALVELLATGLIGSLYLLSSNGPHGDSCSRAGLRACGPASVHRGFWKLGP